MNKQEIKTPKSFAVLISVKDGNINGDPNMENMPRVDFGNGKGVITPVCIKHKLRRRAKALGKEVFVLPESEVGDGNTSLQDRSKNTLGERKEKWTDAQNQAFVDKATKKYWDIAAFGNLFAYRGEKNNIGAKGCVTIKAATSIDPITVNELPITRCVEGSVKAKASDMGDTMGGTYQYVKYGLYVVYGEINAKQAQKANFTEDDANVLKESLRTLFVDDESAARPAGSTTVEKIFWWDHKQAEGDLSAGKLFRTLHISRKEGVAEATSFDDYDVSVDDLPNGPVLETIEGF